MNSTGLELEVELKLELGTLSLNPSSTLRRPSSSLRGVISDEDHVTIDSALLSVVFLVSFVGVVTNSINIRTFIAMGLEDGITVSLMGLAASDLGFSLFGCILGGSHVISGVEVTYDLKILPIHPKLVFGVFSVNIAFMFYQVTCMTTAFMAVARCMCVAMPFRFKDFFTKSRSIFALVTFNLIAAASYIPVLSQTGVQRKFDPVVNRTRLVLWMSSQRSDIKDATTFVHFVVIVIVSSLVVGVCIPIMAKHLRQSVNLRYGIMALGRNESTDGSGGNGNTPQQGGHKLSGKELQVVRQVIVICVIYCLSMLPTIFFALYRLVQEDFDVGKEQANLYFTTGAVMIILELINSSSTFSVYYAYNSKFRSTCFSFQSKNPQK